MISRLVIPIAAIVVGVPGVVAFVSLLANHTRKMKELEVREKEAGADALRPAVDALTDDVHDLRSHLAEVQERLDFAERMLASGKPAADD